MGKQGGVARGIIIRQASLDRYYENPNRCVQCLEIIPVPAGVRVSVIKQKKFCNHSCSAAYTNRSPDRRKPPMLKCQRCGKEETSFKTPDGRYTQRRFCVACSPIQATESRGRMVLAGISKGALFAGRKNWQSARSFIARHAQEVLQSIGRLKRCALCPYDKHVDVCHRRPVADFPNEATIEQINHPDNLVYLCKVHHWEFDHGLTTLQSPNAQI